MEAISSPRLAAGATGMRNAPVPYMVKNTFIDLAPAPGEQARTEGVYSTWPIAKPPGSSESSPVKAAEAESSTSRTTASAASSRGFQRKPSLEEGEIADEDAGQTLPRDKPFPYAGISCGSGMHGTGTCKPCAWMHRDADGCRNGQQCEYCHLCPPGELRRRKRDKMQRRMDEIRQAQALAAANEPASTLASSSSLMSSTLAEAGVGIMRDSNADYDRRTTTMTSISELEPCYVEVGCSTADQKDAGFPGLALPILENGAKQTSAASTRGSSGKKATPPGSSVGSAGHGAGVCRPCAWVHKMPGGKGCKNASSCKYCHLCPPGELKRRKRDKWENLAEPGGSDATAASPLPQDDDLSTTSSTVFETDPAAAIVAMR